MILTAVEMLCRPMLEQRIGTYQHGFVSNKSTGTALETVINKIKGNKSMKVLEFDLKSFFNLANVYRSCSEVESLIPGMGRWIIDLTYAARIELDEYKPEAELKATSDPNIFIRSGFTQGSPLSPIMSILALEHTDLPKLEGLLMYADDGLVIGVDPLADAMAHQDHYLYWIERNLKKNESGFSGLDLDREALAR